MSEQVEQINDCKGFDLLYKTAVVSLLGYVFFSDVVYAKLHFAIFKPATALCTLFFSCLYFALNWKNVKFKSLLVVTVLLTILYVIILHNQSSSYLYTPIFGILLIQKTHFSLKAIDVIFILQFILIAFEFFTHSHIYTQVTTGLFTIQEFDFDYETIMDDTGFRCKGMFVGILVATCFVINYSLIHRNDYKRTFWAFVMAVLINGRLAILICGFLFLYNYYMKHNKYAEKFNIRYIIAFGAVIAIVLMSFAIGSKSTAVVNFFNVFDFEDTSNAGRIVRYGLGLNALLNYSARELVFGSTYELFDQWNRPVPTESDAIGMLLEIGVVGFCFIVVSIIKGWRSGGQPFLMPNMVSHKLALFMSMLAIIQYRQLSGNLRGLMFWLLLLLIICENNYRKIYK